MRKWRKEREEARVRATSPRKHDGMNEWPFDWGSMRDGDGGGDGVSGCTRATDAGMLSGTFGTLVFLPSWDRTK